MKIKHFGIFKNGMENLSWETLRNTETERPYYLPYTKEEYLLKVEAETPSHKTQIILNEIRKSGLQNLFSIGSGIAAQEFQLKKFSSYKVIVTDYNKSIFRLKQFEIFDDAFILDALKDPLPIDETYFVLFPRIDTEFDDHQLSKLFAKCHNSGVTHICLIPAELLSIRIIVSEIKTLIISMLRRKKRIFCGYARSLGSFKKIWEPYYKLSLQYKNGQPIFFLQSK